MSVLKPVLHRIFVLPEDAGDVDDRVVSARKLGLVVELDKREQKAVTMGTVLSIGNTAFAAFGSNATDEGITVGSKVVYAKYAGASVPNQEYIILNDEDIIGVYND